MQSCSLLHTENSLPMLIVHKGARHQILDYSDRKVESPLSRSCEELLLGPCLLFRPPLSISRVIIHNLSIKLNPLLFTQFLPHAREGVDILPKDGPLLALCHKRRLQHHLPCICCARLYPDNHTSLVLRQQFRNPSAALHLLVPIVHVEQHDDVDETLRARRLHQPAVWRLIEQICSYEAVLETVLVVKELLPCDFVLLKMVGAP